MHTCLHTNNRKSTEPSSCPKVNKNPLSTLTCQSVRPAPPTQGVVAIPAISISPSELVGNQSSVLAPAHSDLVVAAAAHQIRTKERLSASFFESIFSNIERNPLVAVDDVGKHMWSPCLATEVEDFFKTHDPSYAQQPPKKMAPWEAFCRISSLDENHFRLLSFRDTPPVRPPISDMGVRDRYQTGHTLGSFIVNKKVMVYRVVFGHVGFVIAYNELDPHELNAMNTVRRNVIKMVFFFAHFLSFFLSC